jgi:SAM-dependent methyltransferase
MPEPKLAPTRCALCSTGGNAEELYPARFSAGDLNSAVFSARRLPDRVHFRVVRCRACGLLRSDPAAPPGELERLYAGATFEYSAEAENLKATYGRYIALAGGLLRTRGAMLDIGCGNGFALEAARAAGFGRAAGVEPSPAAAEKAAPGIRPFITVGQMRKGLLPDSSFDLACLFQVIDHVPDPGGLLELCRAALRPGGLLLALTHNADALSARLLGERSPIIDIEHTYLFSPRTLSRLAVSRGFSVLESGTAWNTYSLHYLARLLPLPAAVKKGLLGLLGGGAGRLPLRVPLGNFYLLSRKPEGAG